MSGERLRDRRVRQSALRSAAGGKKLPELEALTMAYNAVKQGAAGVDMGRNIFQLDAPHAMISAVHVVVHENLKPADGFEMFKVLKAKK